MQITYQERCISMEKIGLLAATAFQRHCCSVKFLQIKVRFAQSISVILTNKLYINILSLWKVLSCGEGWK